MNSRMSKFLKFSRSWTLKLGVEVAVMFEVLHYVGRGIIYKVQKTNVQFKVIVQLLEYHKEFPDLKLAIPLDGLTYIRMCIGKHLKWNGYDPCFIANLPFEAELESS